MRQQFGILYHQLKGRYQGINQNKENLHFYQSRQIANLLEQTSAEIPLYQFYKQATLHEFPIIDKTFVQEHFARLNRKKLSCDKVLQSSSQSSMVFHQSLGTAGLPGIYLHSAPEKRSSLGNFFSKIFPRTFWQSKRIAVFHLSPTPYISGYGLYLDLHGDFSSHVELLKKFNPQVLVGSVQTLMALAKLQSSGQMLLQCQKIIATAEVLTPLAQKTIMTAFNQPVHQLYQCAEGLFGMTCAKGVLHLNEEEYFFEKEWIDQERLRFVPVITTLKRRLQPLIRYRMEDILQIKKEPCACGSPSLAIDNIIGRCEDVLYFKARMHSGLKPLYADMVNQVFSKVKALSQYQVLQHSMRLLEIKLQAEDFSQAQNEISCQLQKLWSQEGIEPPLLEFTTLESPSLHQMFRTTKRLVKSTVTLLT